MGIKWFIVLAWQNFKASNGQTTLYYWTGSYHCKVNHLFSSIVIGSINCYGNKWNSSWTNQEHSTWLSQHPRVFHIISTRAVIDQPFLW